MDLHYLELEVLGENIGHNICIHFFLFFIIPFFIRFELGEQLVERDNILEANGTSLSPESLSADDYAKVKEVLTS